MSREIFIDIVRYFIIYICMMGEVGVMGEIEFLELVFSLTLLGMLRVIRPEAGEEPSGSSMFAKLAVEEFFEFFSSSWL